MSDADLVYIRSIIRKMDRAGDFEHEPALPNTLDEIEDLEIDECEECFRSTAFVAFLIGARGRTELAGFDLAKDITYIPEDGKFVVDFGKRGKLASGQVQQDSQLAYVRCLCGDRSVAHLCLHAHLSKAKIDGFANFHEKYLGDKTHSLRIGTLCHLMNAGVGEARVASHLRWSGLQMLLYYNRANTYRRSRYLSLKFVAGAE